MKPQTTVYIQNMTSQVIKCPSSSRPGQNRFKSLFQPPRSLTPDTHLYQDYLLKSSSITIQQTVPDNGKPRETLAALSKHPRAKMSRFNHRLTTLFAYLKTHNPFLPNLAGMVFIMFNYPLFHATQSLPYELTLLIEYNKTE